MSLPDQDRGRLRISPRSRQSSSQAALRRATRRRSATAISGARTASSPPGCSSSPAPPPDEKRAIGRWANELKQAHRGALDGVSGAGGTAARARRGAVGRHAAGPSAAARSPPSADARARSHGRHLHAHGIRDRRGAGDRRRVALLRRAEHAGRASRARHAGHARIWRRRSRARPAGPTICGRMLRTHTSSIQIRYMQATSRRSASWRPAACTAATIST